MTIFQHQPQRALALANGDLVDVTAIARDGLFVLPTAVTRRAWVAAVTSSRKTPLDEQRHDETERIRRLLSCAFNAIQNRWREDLQRLEFDLPTHPGTPPSDATTFVIVTTADDNGQPALTVGLQDELGAVSSRESD